MATTTDKYIVEVSARLVGDEVFATLTNRMQQLQRENSNLRKSLKESGVAFTDIARTGGNAAAGVSRMGGLFQNVSYQITDFAVQTTGGVDALRAFSQQAPQVAGALGAAGIGGAAGIAAFAVASLAAALAPAIIAMFKGADAAKLLSDQLTSIEDRSIDIGKIFGGAEDPIADLKNLTAQGEQFKNVLIDINNVQRQQTLDVLQKQLKNITNEFRGLTEAMQIQGEGSGMFYGNLTAQLSNKRTIDELNESFGITIQQAKELQPLIQQIINPTSGKQDITDYEKLLFVFSTINAEGETAQKNAKEITEALTRLIELNVQAGTFSLGGKEDDTKQLDKLNSQWESIAASARTANEAFEEQIALVIKLGFQLEKPKSDVDEIISRLSDERAKDLFKELAADTETFAGGVVSAVQAIDEMTVNAEYLAGIRQMMNQAADESQWAAMARLLKDAATPAEQLRLALHEIRNDAEKDQQLRKSFDEFRKSAQLTNAELKAMEKQLFKTTETAKTELDAIGVALGQTLSTQVGNFVDTMFKAEASFSDMAQAMLMDIAKLIIQMTILAQIKMALAGTGFGNFLGIAAPAASARGNVFSGGQITPFANGGIVNKPTIFPMANGIGLMGEAGPEAIMPLSRGPDGKLGIKSQTVTVNVINNGGSEATVQETMDSSGGLRIDVLVESAVDSAISRGRFDKSLSNLYGLRRRGG